MQSHQFRAMNTIILLEAEGSETSQAFDTAQRFIKNSEQRFTRFKETSELSALNRSAGKWFSASSEMMELMTTAMHCHKATGGLFDTSVLPYLEAAGYTQSMDQLWLLGPSQQPENYPHKSEIPFTEVEIDKARNRIRLPKNMKIDLGGIAKGWIAEKAAKLMAMHSPACAVNAGGDMFLVGQPIGQKNWEILLEDPRNPSQDLMILLVEKGAVATSSVTKRIWHQGELKRHHLIDPRNGQPAETMWLSVTVFAPNTALAETFAKAILIAGPIEAERLLANNPNISFLAVDTQGQIWKSPAEKESIYEYA